jgi:hypothetical protein
MHVHALIDHGVPLTCSCLQLKLCARPVTTIYVQALGTFQLSWGRVTN